jgi:hypothetical protein
MISGASGPNLLEGPPTLTSATVSGSDLTVNGQLNGTVPETKYRIEFFAGDATFGSFKQFLGFRDVTTDNIGNVPGGFTAVLTGVDVAKGTAVSATATDQNGNTTGFAQAVTAGSPATLVPPPLPPPTVSAPPTTSTGPAAAPQQSPTQLQILEMALDALLVVEGVLFNKPALFNLGLGSYFLETANQPAGVQSQLQQDFVKDATTDAEVGLAQP